MPSAPTVTPLSVPNKAPSTVELVNVDALSNCDSPFDAPTVPKSSVSGCAFRPELAPHGMLSESEPPEVVDEPSVDVSPASVPSGLKFTVPVASSGEEDDKFAASPA